MKSTLEKDLKKRKKKERMKFLIDGGLIVRVFPLKPARLDTFGRLLTVAPYLQKQTVELKRMGKSSDYVVDFPFGNESVIAWSHFSHRVIASYPLDHLIQPSCCEYRVSDLRLPVYFLFLEVIFFPYIRPFCLSTVLHCEPLATSIPFQRNVYHILSRP